MHFSQLRQWSLAAIQRKFFVRHVGVGLIGGRTYHNVITKFCDVEHFRSTRSRTHTLLNMATAPDKFRPRPDREQLATSRLHKLQRDAAPTGR
ncbi:hypothetical protein ANTRET_LOCUS536 [Anthophora retusa]